MNQHDDDKQAIRELIISAIVAAWHGHDEQAITLASESIDCAYLAVGKNKAGPLIISIYTEMHNDLQIKFMMLLSLLEQAADETNHSVTISKPSENRD